MFKKKVDKKTIGRLLGYVFKEYKVQFVIVMILVVLSSLTSIASSLFMETLIDDYISPMLLQENPVFTPLLKALAIMACIYIIGILSSYFYNIIMSKTSQGTLKTIRDEMFEKMEKLPIRYFDTHTHGDIMSYYTNDTDTLRELISRGIPEIVSMVITIISTFIAMLCTSAYLTLLVIVVAIVMFKVTKNIGGKSSRYFIKQQASIAKANGYIEEMINGQKVIKVFSHEEEAIENFKKINDELCNDTTLANKYSNILMPALANLGNIQFVLVGVLGGLLAINGIGGITVGAIASFLSLSKSFTMPISRLSQQINAIVMAMAGAKRIFAFMDEEKEFDNGYVTLVNAEKISDEIKETDHYTGMWAWKHPHHDGR